MRSNSIFPPHPRPFTPERKKVLSSQSPLFYAKATHNEKTIVCDLEARMTDSELYSQTKMAIYEDINHCYEEGETLNLFLSCELQCHWSNRSKCNWVTSGQKSVLCCPNKTPDDAFRRVTVMCLHACMFVLLILPSSTVLHLLLLHLLPSTFALDIPEDSICAENYLFFGGGRTLGCTKWWPNGVNQEGGRRCPS